jgi:hypothetical protein
MADGTPVSEAAQHPTVLLAPRTAGGSRPEETRLELLEVLATTAHARLRALALIGVAGFGAGAVLALTLPALLGRPPWEQAVMSGLCAFLTVISLAVWSYARRARPAASRIITVGLGYVIIAAFAMAVAEVAIGPRAAGDYDGVPGMCIWIVLFPLVIPCLPSQALIAALLAATTLPIAYQGFVWMGREPSDPTALIRWYAPGYFCAGLAWAAAWVFGRMAGDVARSRREVRELGSYQLEELLGHGGMGEVWRARHRLLPRQAAVKFVRPTEDLRADPQAIAEMGRRFEREARAIAMLRSPHTIQMYDYGMSPDGDLYYAMELLDGYDLESLVARFGPQPEARVARILAQACLSLAEAHRAGLVHRDVKPGNLMLCRLGEDLDIAKVLDFGLVGAAQNQPAVPGSAHGATGFAGTPGYIAPELIFGGGMATPASDLYGLGAVGYWLLTGSTVFPATDGSEDLVAHSMDRPKPPSERLGRRIQPQLEALILACLAKKPAERPASALALRESLLAIVFAETWHEEQARSWWLEAGART